VHCPAGDEAADELVDGADAKRGTLPPEGDLETVPDGPKVSRLAEKEARLHERRLEQIKNKCQEPTINRLISHFKSMACYKNAARTKAGGIRSNFQAEALGNFEVEQERDRAPQHDKPDEKYDDCGPRLHPRLVVMLAAHSHRHFHSALPGAPAPCGP